MECADTPLWALPDDEVVACLDTVHAAEQALAAAQLHLIRQVDSRGLPATQHATSCASWLRQRLRVGMCTARRLVELARAVDNRVVLDQALSAGAVNLEQATAIDACVGDLPADAGAEVAAKAESMLIGWAADFDPQALRRLGARVLEHVAPEVAEQAEAAVLARQEARAYAGRSLSMVSGGAGRVRLTGWLDDEAAAVPTAALDPLCAPRRGPSVQHAGATQGLVHDAAAAGAAVQRAGALSAIPGGDGAADAVRDDRTAGQRRADALVEICRLALHTGELPANGGDRPQVTVTVAFDPLRRALGAGTLDTGERLTAAQVRRLACDAHLMPAVLGSQGQVLDVGQSRRLITGALRRALVLRDHGCAFPGCQRPPRWCEGHHIVSWVDGGPTSLDNAVLLCGHHHRIVHHSDWTVRLGSDCLPDFLPPPHLDHDRRPRRNCFHRRT